MTFRTPRSKRFSRICSAVTIAALLALSAAPVLAQMTPVPAAGVSADKVLKKTVEQRLGVPKVDSIIRMPVGGLYEVRVGTDIFYTDAKGDYLILGNIIDMRSRENLTKKRVEALVEAATPAVKLADLPLESAIKIVKGNGKRQVAIFEDPNCGYCKHLESSLVELNDITIHVFLYAVLGPDSVAKSKSIWCSADRAKAWTDWMHGNIVPLAAGTCATPIEKIAELGRKLRVDGTPTLIFANGKRVPGAIPADELQKLLAMAGS